MKLKIRHPIVIELLPKEAEELLETLKCYFDETSEFFSPVAEALIADLERFVT